MVEDQVIEELVDIVEDLEVRETKEKRHQPQEQE
jgi:hypothetical protein